jgi:hypothetical protein
MAEPTFFEMLKALYTKAPIEYDDKILNPYLMLMWVSHDKDNFESVEAIAKYLYVIKHKHIWEYLRYTLPYHRNKFLKYVKKNKLDNDELIEELCNEYGISEMEARLYV